MIIYHIKGTKKRMKTKNKRNYLKQDGITLIALVVTIVVLLILAGVSINALFGQDGIIQKAKDAQNKMDEATQNDLDAINGLNEWINKNINGTNGGEDIEKGDFSATVVLNPAENEAQPTFEQKKEIAAILFAAAAPRCPVRTRPRCRRGAAQYRPRWPLCRRTFPGS